MHFWSTCVALPEYENTYVFGLGSGQIQRPYQLTAGTAYTHKRDDEKQSGVSHFQ